MCVVYTCNRCGTGSVFVPWVCGCVSAAPCTDSPACCEPGWPCCVHSSGCLSPGPAGSASSAAPSSASGCFGALPTVKHTHALQVWHRQTNIYIVLCRTLPCFPMRHDRTNLPYTLSNVRIVHANNMMLGLLFFLSLETDWKFYRS